MRLSRGLRHSLSGAAAALALTAAAVAPTPPPIRAAGETATRTAAWLPQPRPAYPGGPRAPLNRWLAAGERASQTLPRAHPRVLFIGDSITQWWGYWGRATWNRVFAPLGAYDDGVVGDTTSNVLARIEAGQLPPPGAAPPVVVLLIGTNDIGAGQPPSSVARGIEAVVAALQRDLPRSRIVVLGVLPRGVPGSGDRAAVAAVNAMLRGDRAPGLTYLDLAATLLRPDGSFRPGTMRPDLLHPAAGGYAGMAGPILAAVEEDLRGR
ncbi:MAG TPA: GDSL-type esterase/lipase family protein [Acidimicrobiales bacterium]|nr:GDSL-type esterase/lipase family protein [Acidimicrobiales bacterium]